MVDIVPSTHSRSLPGPRPRALFYVFDGGSGIGHLRRLARIAAAMQERFSCLIVTGHLAGPQWMVPDGCEYVRLLAWDSLIPAKAAYWGKQPFLDISLDEAVRLRSAMLLGVVNGFRPDVMFVDHLPLGANAELVPVLAATACRKYLVTRGIQNETEDLQRLVLGGDALSALRADYDRILSAVDPRVFDLANQYDLPADIVDKIVSVGYVAPEPTPSHREQARARRQIASDATWVVASVGSGQWGEPLVEACIAVAARYTDVYFDIVMGPRTRLSHAMIDPDAPASQRVRLHATSPDLESLHAAADVVVTAGGYNSLLEAIQGEARILCIPYRKDHRDEPFRHASLLQPYVDLRIATELDELEQLLRTAVEACRAGPVTDRRSALRMDGAHRIAQLVSDDLAEES